MATAKRKPTAKKVRAKKTPAKRGAEKNDNKTQRTSASVSSFVASIADEALRKDLKTVIDMMKHASGEAPAMWGSSIVGFGRYHYKYPSGREGDFFLTGISPRKSNLTIYMMPGFAQHQALLSRLGKHKTGKSCLYIKQLADVHMPTLEKLIVASLAEMKRRYPS